MDSSSYSEASTATMGPSSGSGDHHHHQQMRSSSGSSPKLANGTIANGKPETMTKDKRKQAPNKEDDSSRPVLMLVVIFLTSALALSYVYFMFPKLDESERSAVKFPFNIEDAKQLAKVLDRYKDMYYIEVMGGIILAYIFLQAFAIPGSLFLSILSGFLFHFAVALPLVCFCSAFGATLCYLLSQVAGRRVVKKFFPERSQKWSEQIEEHKDSLFNYMLFLRMTPILPNWFINLVAPVIGVPLAPFAFGTFFGVAPPSVIAIQAGKTLHTMTSSSEAFSWRSMAILGVLAVLSLVPSLFKKKLKAKLA